VVAPVFGSRPVARKPLLVLLVFGVLLVIVGITASAQALMVSAYASSSTFSAIVEGDVATVRGFTVQALSGVGASSLDPADLERIDADLATLLAKGGISRAEIRTSDGWILASSTADGAHDPAAAGSRTRSADFAAAASGTPRVALVEAGDAETDPTGLPPTLIREYLPLQQAGSTVLVVALWRDAVPVLSALDDLRRDVVIVTLSAAVIAAGILFLVFRSAQATIHRQTLALVRATELDPLTNTLNHGALVAHLAMEVERARRSDMPLGVALLDIDNFRLLNDTHGHEAGDAALLVVTAAVRRELPATSVMGRYGPDELLIVAGRDAIVELEPMIDRIRSALAVESLQFETTERLPLTISAGICAFPVNGGSVTELLSTTAATLQEARASGGDAVRVASTTAPPHGDETAARFSVLQGLVFAIDTKDRYTKRHSADVARYGAFLAEQLGLDAATVDVVHAAGLLHDIGKIGIPDAILRKPARLTVQEVEVVKQHVALGDMIVRGIPDLDAVRAGIRHHHERWDGRGYLDALAGDDIPLVARILAVGDAFSAMTTTRPYRKALDVREALRRLGDAAGTQLDEKFVETFIHAIETVPGAPLPGLEPTATSWRPGRRVA
jgi:diguanylate cyclase (GGDEF)-like protein/putative nucleotidyltransferase with HDIG domain